MTNKFKICFIQKYDPDVLLLYDHNLGSINKYDKKESPMCFEKYFYYVELGRIKPNLLEKQLFNVTLVKIFRVYYHSHSLKYSHLIVSRQNTRSY